MISVIIAAAGSGSRMGGGIKKQYRKIENLTVLERTVKAFCALKECKQMIIAVPKDDIEYTKDLLNSFVGITVVAGGSTRAESVVNALESVTEDFVLVHDAARCFVSEDVIKRVIEGLKDADGVVPCVSPKDTIRTKSETLERSSLYCVQTPQGFKTEVLRKAYEKAMFDSFTGTDDASLLDHMGVFVKLVEGSYENIKITTEEDMPSVIRTGTGYDVHRLVSGRELWLGCTKIEYEKGLLGHSDADVCSHAIADALLGAAGLRDIGYYFPDNAKETEGMPARVLLKKVLELIRQSGYEIVNVDATIAAQVPKLSPHIEEMKNNTAEALEININQLSIKATTEEGLGITGSGEAMTTYAVAALRG